MHKLTALITLILLLITVSATAQIPKTISYQGLLTDVNGIAVSDGSYDLTFRLYNTSDGGSPLWSETQSVDVTNGILNVILGSSVPLNLSFDEGYYLGISVNGSNELTPRITLTSTAYSFKALSVADNSIGSSNISDGEVVRSVNNLTDEVILEGGDNILISQDGNTLTITTTSLSAGDITGITAGEGLLGGGTSGEVSIDVDFAGSGASDAVARSDHDHDDLYINEGQTNAINTDMIIDETVTESKIATNAVTQSKIVNNAVTAEKIDPDIISTIDGVANDAGDIDFIAGSNMSIIADDANNTISFSSSGGTGGGDITAVYAGTGLTGGGTNADVTLNVDLAGNGAANTVSRSDHIHDATYVNEGQENSVTTTMIQDNSVLGDDIADNAVGNSEIANQAVTSEKIQDGQVVKSLNQLMDNVRIVEGDNISVITESDSITISVTALPETNSLDQAYDEGGAGAGRTITADSGAVTIDGVDGFLSTGTIGSGTIPIEGMGTRMMWYPKKAAFRVGDVRSGQWDDSNIGYYSIAAGYNATAMNSHSVSLGAGTTASGSSSVALGTGTSASATYSTAMGRNTTASGNYSIAMGSGTAASGPYSTAMGSNTTASGGTSLAMGYSTTASGPYSTAMGGGIEANGDYSVAIALSNQYGISVTQDNTMAIMGGRVGIGTPAPAAGLHLSGTGFPNSFMFIEGASGIDAGMRLYEDGTPKWHIFNNATSDGLQIYNTGGARTVFFAEQSTGFVGIGRTNPNWQLHVETNSTSAVAMFENDNQGSDSDGIIIKAGRIVNPSYDVDFVLFADGNGDYIGQIDGNNAGGVRYVTTSDARLKTNIGDYTGGLEKVSSIQVRNYEMKSDPGKERIGLIAQELQKIYPQAVSGTPDSDVDKEPMMIDYGRITPILVSAIQELKAEKDKEIAELKSIINELQNKIEALENK